MNRNYILIIMVGFFLNSFSLNVYAQNKQSNEQQKNQSQDIQPRKTQGKKSKVREYDFSGDDIEGELVQPDGDVVDPRNFTIHSELIRIRTDFLNEVVKSAEDL